MSEHHLITVGHFDDTIAEFGPSPFQDGGNEIYFTKLNVSFRTNKIFLNYYSSASILKDV